MLAWSQKDTLQKMKKFFEFFVFLKNFGVSVLGISSWTQKAHENQKLHIDLPSSGL